MLVIWSGRGAVVPVITFGCLLLTELSTRAYFHDNHYYQAHGWPKMAGFVAAAAIIAVLSIQREGELSADRPTPEKRSLFRKSDTFFLLPMRFWPALLLGLGALFYFVRD